MSFAERVNALDGACLRVFGDAVTYFPQAGGQASIRAVFQPVSEPEPDSPGVYAVLFVRRADLPAAPAKGDEVKIGIERYSVFDIDADSEGGVVLRLRRIN